MAPRGQTLPEATTESAKAARRSFFCELCQKGYARMNDFEAHEGSYDHQHRKRLKEMRQLTKNPNAAAIARAEEKRENQAAGLKSINISLAPGGSTKKKPVFKSTLQPHNAAGLQGSVGAVPIPSALAASISVGPGGDDDLSCAVRNGWADDKYDPRFPTGCDEDCPACQGREEAMQL
ncbi:hypothetical protein K431DRAFT_240031 [Polychaeton citri CBS 116435]|uniref:C2H2-type domain-containing protein n=1 Tax=Polychaeton citri CBS 116435 TaxID=1314669 RepID=A0A9P4USJ2_9PEZI|nr:hypothetical protein K431DRAFT_240031 [Polychaeton citri CBS 116435]